MAKTQDILTDCADLATVAFPARTGPCTAREAALYLAHTDRGQSIRALGRATGAHPSTVSRTVARVEGLRDDPLVDGLIAQIEDRTDPQANRNAPPLTPAEAAEDEVQREAKRFLRRLSEPGAVLVIVPGTDRGGIFCAANGHAKPIAMVPVRMAAEFLRRDWIKLGLRGATTLRYQITEVGRAWLRRTLAEVAQGRASQPGFAEAQSVFAAQHQVAGARIEIDPETGAPEVMRVNLGESPLGWLARRVGPDGKAFLTPDEVEAGERLRVDFEIAQIGPSVAQDWRKFLTPGDRMSGSPSGQGPATGPIGARDRVTKALGALGPGLADVALRACCFLEGLEACERRMGWSARSGKVVLKIALGRLSEHYGLTAFRR